MVQRLALCTEGDAVYNMPESPQDIYANTVPMLRVMVAKRSQRSPAGRKKVARGVV